MTEQLSNDQDDSFPSAIVDDGHRNAPNPLESKPTLLPRPLASIVSFATATSLLGLRIGGFIGSAAISGARIGTLTSFELGRVIIEGILARAGSDVVDSSLGQHGRAEAEGLLERALSTLHYSITSTSFLVSAGFQIGSTSLSSGLAISQFFLSGLDAILGDTETSKAVATIVVLVQREFENPETGARGEKVGLGDLVVGITAFALLQRWGRKKTDQELQETNATELIWDVVVVDDGKQPRELAVQADDDPESPTRETSVRPTLRRSVSFVSATGNQESFEGVGDGASFVSTASSRAFSNVAGHFRNPTEEAFRQRLADQLKPGSSVKLTAESVTEDCVTVEVQGDPDVDIEAPPGFELIAIDRQNSIDGLSKFIFLRKTRKRRHGRFEVDIGTYPNHLSLDSLDNVDTQSLLARVNLELNSSRERQGNAVEDSDVMDAELDADPAAAFDQDYSDNAIGTAVVANQKRTRSPLVQRSDAGAIPMASSDHPQISHFPKGLAHPTSEFIKGAPDNSPLRKAMSKSKSVKNLVEFWSRERQKHPATASRFGSFANPRDIAAVYGGNYPVANTMPPKLLATPRVPVNDFIDASAPDVADSTSISLRDPRPTSSASHRRHRSSVHSMTSVASEGSLVLRSMLGDDGVDDPVPLLHRHGALTGQYPRNNFAANAARFARFSLASYGSNFLRLTGVSSGAELTTLGDSDLPEHHSFSTYTNLPPSTVLLSSYVDAQPGVSSHGEADSGLPLVHYVSLDHTCKAVVVTCRGTLGFEDILADMTCDYTDIVWQSRIYQVHEGVYASAKRLFTAQGGRILWTIKAALEEFEDYGLVLCGHSLGGAVVSVLAILLANRNTTSAGGASRFVTGSSSGSLVLPPNRPIHAYAYGPAACVSPDLQHATKGLVTSIVQGSDVVPFLSIGTLRDFQAMAVAFKSDSHVAKAEVRRRVWQGLIDTFKNKSGAGASGLGFLSQDWLGPVPAAEEDHWAWSALRSLRASLLADKLVPPGEVYLIESAPVLQRHAFVGPSSANEEGSSSKKSGKRKAGKAVNIREEDEGRRSYKPATHVTFRHVRDVERTFAEIKFAAGMFTDHFPARYLRVLEDLEKAVGF